ncbi:YrhB family protein [Nocardia sp. NBC_01503]|uniref:YrhB domain-containing protein n=1 Tax=Nocardia sp. NBC_01503 TaxID=2975997 RepID=UPI002E7AF3E6|nr:YrhB domain-containing protein [Nocardia sp. NBC_01503]WTL32716.1 YrhB family protein [Nocardia sp. NBC_01503]
MTPDTARELAERKLAELAAANELGAVRIVDDAIVETDSDWYFPYDAIAYLEQGEISAALAGNIPIRVEKSSGETSLELPPGW